MFMFSKNERKLLITICMVCAVWVLFAAMWTNICASKTIDRTSLKEVTADDILVEDICSIEYVKQLRLVPPEILQAFVFDGWEFAIDYDHTAELSNDIDAMWAGVTDYPEKKIWIRYPSAVVHEFGHFLWYALEFPERNEELYEIESESAAELLGDYSATNSVEYFAECFAYWIEHQNDEDAMKSFELAAPDTYEYFLELSNNNWNADLYWMYK